MSSTIHELINEIQPSKSIYSLSMHDGYIQIKLIGRPIFPDIANEPLKELLEDAYTEYYKEGRWDKHSSQIKSKICSVIHHNIITFIDKFYPYKYPLRTTLGRWYNNGNSFEVAFNHNKDFQKAIIAIWTFIKNNVTSKNPPDKERDISIEHAIKALNFIYTKYKIKDSIRY